RPPGYGLGRHGWISVTIPATTSAKRWREIEEWIRTSYTLVAPKKLARAVLDEDMQRGCPEAPRPRPRAAQPIGGDAAPVSSLVGAGSCVADGESPSGAG